MSVQADMELDRLALGGAEEIKTRDPMDRYYTPHKLAEACVSVVHPRVRPAVIVEPSVGGGAFAKACLDRWPSPAPRVVGVDLDPEAPAFRDSRIEAHHGDWLDYVGPTPSMIIGNPPYNNAEAHARKALKIAPLVVLLLRLGFLASIRRRAFWSEHPLSKVHVIRPRPSFTGGGTDNSEYALFTWDQVHLGATELLHLDWR